MPVLNEVRHGASFALLSLRLHRIRQYEYVQHRIAN